MKVRNEEAIIKETLDCWASIYTGGIYIYDDCSDDKTVEICRAHPAVKEVIEGTFFDPDRERAEWFNRQMILARAQQDSGPDDWFGYNDADEFLYNFERFELFSDPNTKAIACRLYDLYINDDEVDLPWQKRNWYGPEFRTIVFFFRNSPYVRYHLPDQRIVSLEPGIQIPLQGEIRHISKGQGIKEWEEMCDYYVKYWPKYAEKWRQRKGKAVHHGYSDFGNKLIRWKDRKYGFSLETQPYGLN